MASENPRDLMLGGRPLSKSGVTAPTVGVIIVNHNYGAYVGGTIDSLRSQTYPLFECIVVDNGSTDDSVKVARRHVGDDPRFRFILLERNLGHIGGGLAGLAEIRNEFVVFVDADDSLLPDFLASHVQAHLASAFGVGLTSSNVIEIDAAGMALTGTRPGFARASDAEALRPLESAPRVSVLSDDAFQELRSGSRYLPNSMLGWHWAPGTANMYRKSLLDLFAFETAGQPIFGGVDSHFNLICHAMTGSVLISRPHSIRRLHGDNVYARVPGLANIGTGNATATRANIEVRRQVLITHMSRAERNQDFLTADLFFGVFDHLANLYPVERKRFYESLEPSLIEHFPRMAGVYGGKTVLKQLRGRLPFRSLVRIATARDAPATRLLRTIGLWARRLVPGRRRRKPAGPAR